MILDILTILLQVYLAIVLVGLIILLWILAIELSERKVKLANTFTNFLICVLLILIPVLNIFVIKRALKEI